MNYKDIHIFTASTPLNALLCATKASTLNGEKYLYLIDQEAHLKEKNIKLFSKLENNIFAKVTAISERKKSILSIYKKKTVLKKIDNRKEILKANHLWMCNDRRLENQKLIRSIKSQGGTIHYIDDGFYSYQEKIWATNTITAKINHTLRKILYGKWVKSIDSIGKGPHIDDIALMLPKASMHLSHKKTESFDKIAFKKILDEIWHTSDVEDIPYGCLIALPHSSQMNKKLSDQITKLIASQPKLTTVLKTHPRDANSPLKLPQAIYLEDNTTPIEYYLCRHPFDTVISGKSTVLITAKWLGIKNIFSYSNDDILNILDIKYLGDKSNNEI